LVSTPGRIIASQLYRQTDSFTKLKLQQDYISNKTLAEKAEGVCSSHESAVRAISIGHGSPVISLQGCRERHPRANTGGKTAIPRLAEANGEEAQGHVTILCLFCTLGLFLA